MDIQAIRDQWLQICGCCDAGLAMDCTCPQVDPRRVIQDLCDEVERLRGACWDVRRAAEHQYPSQLGNDILRLVTREMCGVDETPRTH